MIKRVAKVIALFAYGEPFEKLSDDIQKQCGVAARHTILAMREPSDRMVSLGADIMDPTWGYADKDIALTWAKDSFNIMIGAALDDANKRPENNGDKK